MWRPAKKEQKDRRKKFRFPINRELRYKVLDRDTIIAAGAGHTLDIGSGGVAFSADRDLQPGAFIELSISWPVLLDENCPMRLVVFGRLLRSGGRRTACSVDKYEFRTQARALATVPRNDVRLIRWADTIRKEELKLRVVNA
ncbi:MAG TPA: PilZ domain-containing protein [Bryobacteraceae bacterium]|jgi:hypothetical protein